MIESIVAGARKAFDERGPAIECQLAALAAEQARLESDRANVLDAIAAGGGRTLLERLRAVETQLAGLGEPEQRLRDELARLRRTALDETAARRAAERIATVWPDLWADERRRVVQVLVERVDVRGDEVEVAIRAGILVEA